MIKFFITLIKHIAAAPSYLYRIPFHAAIFGTGLSVEILLFLFWVRAKNDKTIQETAEAHGSRPLMNHTDAEGEAECNIKSDSSKRRAVQTACLVFLVFYLVFLSILTTIVRKPVNGYLYDFHVLRSFRVSD